MKLNNLYLIILTAFFSTLSLILDQGVFQIEKKIISNEINIETYKNQIFETKSNHIHYNNHFQQLSYKLEMHVNQYLNEEIQIKKQGKINGKYNEENKPLNLSQYALSDLTDIYAPFLKPRSRPYLLSVNNEKIANLNLEINKSIKLTEFNVEKLELIRDYFFEITKIHENDIITSEEYLTEDDNELNGLRSLRQFLIVLAFSLNICALMALLYYFKSILSNRLSKSEALSN